MLSSSLQLRADELYLINGEVLQGTFLKIQGEFYAFKTQKGFVKYIPEDEVDDLHIEKREVLALQQK